MDVHGYTHISRRTTFLFCFFFPQNKTDKLGRGGGGESIKREIIERVEGRKKIKDKKLFLCPWLFRVHRVFVCVKAVGISLRENHATNSSSLSSSPRATWQQPNVVDICKRLYNLTTTTATKNESRSRSVDSQSQSIQRIK